MSDSIRLLYRLAKESAEYLHTAAECRPDDVPDLLGILARTVKQIWSNRGQLPCAEREMIRLVGEAVEGAARRQITPAIAAALKELVYESLGAAGLSSDRGKRAHALASALKWAHDRASGPTPHLNQALADVPVG
ncbi:hypothetical protein [Limnoglobus roseus]|uniref:Uncharacterized protein n=1 Tax=Limnoglobus roseus TaxID=2598579 RepID=A0A5C1AJU8_9BACT|nr:hypothetical protein [Limnoglobus roseus]QEL19481.1 hypothetical protein PX52LOC_06554 [Limnoglobus roseus]